MKSAVYQGFRQSNCRRRFILRFLFGLSLFFLLTLSLSPTKRLSAARAAQSKGSVRVSGHALLPGGAPADASTVVWLEAPGLHGAPLRRAVMDQRQKTFIPHILVVTPHTRIQFPNHDTVFHNVFAEFEAKRFDLGMYPQNTSKLQTFDKPGVVSLLCNIHPRMNAFILIVDSPYFVVADKKGAFEMKNVAPGTYTLHAWHESGAVASQPVSVAEGDGGAPMTVSLKTR